MYSGQETLTSEEFWFSDFFIRVITQIKKITVQTIPFEPILSQSLPAGRQGSCDSLMSKL
jgi:hypothetical protein